MSDDLVSIIIPVHNQIEYTRLCVDSMRKRTKCPYELIFTDNGCKDGTLDYLRKLPGIKTVSNAENLGFAKACNQGIGLAQGSYILLLNNDTIVTDGWLERLLECARSDVSIGIVGPMTNRTGGVQIDRNPQYSSIREMHEYAQNYRLVHMGEWFDTRWVMGFCMLIKRQVIRTIGNLDERFEIGNCEDRDYCVRAKQAGFRIVVARDVFIHHFGARTFIGMRANYSRILKRNRRIFYKKWPSLRGEFVKRPESKQPKDACTLFQ